MKLENQDNQDSNIQLMLQIIHFKIYFSLGMIPYVWVISRGTNSTDSFLNTQVQVQKMEKIQIHVLLHLC